MMQLVLNCLPGLLHVLVDNIQDQQLELPTIFLRLKDEVFSFRNNHKNLDRSYKKDLDLWGCLGGVKLV